MGKLKCQKPNQKQRNALMGLIGAVRSGTIKKPRYSKYYAETLDKQKVPWFVQNRVAYMSEQNNKYGNTVIDEAYDDYCKFQKKRS